MASKIETLVRSAIKLFSHFKPDLHHHQHNIISSASLLSQNPSFLELQQLASSITGTDVGLPEPQRYVSPAAPVTYMEIFENDSISIGVFILQDGAKIPLHNHPGMHGILRVLHGTVSVQNFTQIVKAEKKLFGRETVRGIKHPTQFLTVDDTPAVLTPSDHNIHEVIAVGGSASFLDILAPPYDIEGRSGTKRDCFYYHPMETTDKGVYLLRQIPSPPTFWCDSLPYQGPLIDVDFE